MDSSRNQKLPVLFAASLVALVALLIASTIVDTAAVPVPKIINNNLMRYGRFCGPGPDNAMWGYLTPVDGVDQSCMQHDQQYAQCFSSLIEDTGVKHVPKIINQVMAARGVLVPAFLLRWAWNRVPSYMRCMHEADKALVDNFEAILATHAYPSWWTNTALAPEGTQGVYGFKQACVLGAPWGGRCAVTTHRLSEIMLAMFRRSVDTDLSVAPLRALATSSSPSAAERRKTNTTAGSGCSTQPSLGLYVL